MSTLLQKLGIERIEHLNRHELYDLADAIIKIADAKPMPPAEDVRRELIRERLQDMKDNPDNWTDADEVFAKLEAKYGQ